MSRVHDKKYKSTPCAFFSRGICRNGDSCTFLHEGGEGGDEAVIGSGEPGQRKPSSSGGWTVVEKRPRQKKPRSYFGVYSHNPDQQDPLAYKTKLCAFFDQGGCSYGASCCFAHGSSDLHTRA